MARGSTLHAIPSLSVKKTTLIRQISPVDSLTDTDMLLSDPAAEPGSAKGSPGATKALRSALRVLNMFAEGKPSYTVAELAVATGMSTSHISKILAALEDARLLVQDEATRAYSVASRAFALGSQFFNHDGLVREALPVLRALTEETRHSSRLSIPADNRVMYLIGQNGALFIDSPWKIGTYVAWHASSAGQVLLAFMSPEESERFQAELPLTPVTDLTITDRTALRARVAQVRSQGYASHRGEHTPGLAAMGVPVFGKTGEVVAVISLTYPAHVVPENEEPELLVPLRKAARVLSQRIGCAVYPFG